MKNVKKIIFALLLCIPMILGLSRCSVSYRFNGASIDYTRIKTINITDFQNLAPIVYPPLAQKFSEDLKHRFQTRTRLVQTNNVGDLNIEGEIVGYDLTAEAVQEDAYAANTKLTMRVKVRFTNMVNEKESFEKEFSSFQSFSSDLMFNDVQDKLCTDLTEDIINQIFNATVENW